MALSALRHVGRILHYAYNLQFSQLSGIGGLQISQSGSYIIFSGGAGGSISVNGGSPINGVVNLLGAGTILVSQNGNDVYVSGSGIGSSSIIYRSYGWYTDQVYSGSMIGAIYRIELNQSISGFFANTKYASDANIFMDVKISPTITGNWTSLFSGVTGQGIPLIPVNQRLSVSGIFVQNTITGGYYLRFDCLANSTGNGLTAQLTCYY